MNVPEKINVSVDIPFMEFIYNVYPISFIVIVGFTIGFTYCLLVRLRHQSYNNKKIERLTKIYNNIIEQKTKM